MSNYDDIIDLIKVSSEVLTPEDFLERIKEDASMIKRSKPVPPKLGQSDFGGISVEYKYPIFRHNRCTS